VERILWKYLYRRLVPETGESIPVGSFKAQDQTAVLIPAIADWVAVVDEQLRKHRRGSPAYVRLMKVRLMTFAEYQTLFKPKMPEEEYRYYRPFEWLRCATENRRQLLLNHRQPDAEKDWLELLAKNAPMLKAFFSIRLSFALPVENIKRHIYISGRSGSGKSEVLKLLFYELQRASQRNRKHALILIDPHGDLASEVRSLRLNADYQRLIYVDPLFVPGATPVLNPLEIRDFSEQNIDLHSQELARAFSELFTDVTLTLQMQTILKPILSTLIRMGGKTLLDVQRFLQDDPALIAAGCASPHPAEREFFKTMFKKSNYAITKNSLYTKIQSLLNTRIFYNLTIGPSTLDLEAEINAGKVLIFSLSKGTLGSEASIAYGRLLLAMLVSIAFRRASVSKSERKPVFLFIDEFHNYASTSLSTILSESRKYGLHLILSNQLLGAELSPGMKEVILTNTAVKLIGQTGGNMIRSMSEETGISTADLRALPPYHFALKTPDRDPILFQIPSFLVGSKHRNALSIRGLTALDTLIAESGLYRPISTHEPDKSPLKPKFNL
jgi:hypothetical protein